MDKEENIKVSMEVPCSMEGLNRHPWANTLKDAFIALCLAIALIAWSFSFQVSEDIIEECKDACASTPTVDSYMKEASATKCVCEYIPKESALKP